MTTHIDLRIMSGVEDGRQVSLELAQGDGLIEGETWLIRFGRHEDNDIHRRYDCFPTRFHERLRWRNASCWLEHCDSKTGTSIEHDLDDLRLNGCIPLIPGALFRVGRTWFRILEE